MEMLKDLNRREWMRNECVPVWHSDGLFLALVDPNPGNKIVWLRGPAGAGKRTILTTLAHYFLSVRISKMGVRSPQHATRRLSASRIPHPAPSTLSAFAPPLVALVVSASAPDARDPIPAAQIQSLNNENATK
jgi:hypothetical protein